MIFLSRMGGGGRDRLAILCCVALAALVTLPGLGRSSLWWDEVHSVRMAQAVLGSDPTKVLGAIAHGVSPYFALLAPFARDGATEAWLRLPSVLAALGLVVVAAGIGRDLGGAALAWRVGLAIAMSPFVIWHAREVRWYTLAWLLAALSLRQGLRAVRGGGRALLASTAWGLLAAMVFSPAIVLLPPILIGSIGARRAATAAAQRSDSAPGRRWALGAAGVTVLVIAAGSWLWKVFLGPALHGGAAGLGFANLGDLSPAAVGYTAVAMATGYTVGPGPIEWHQRPPVMPTLFEGALMGGGVLLVTALALRGILVVRRMASTRAAALLLVMSLLPVAALAAAAVLTGHRFAPRHAGLMALPVLLLAAAGTLPDGGRRRWPVVAGALLLALQALSLAHLHGSVRYLREQVRDAAEYVDRVAAPEDLVLVFGGIDLPWRYYDLGRVPSRIVYADDPETWTVESMPAILAGKSRIVIVRSQAAADDREVPLLAAVQSASSPLASARFPGIEVEMRTQTTVGERP